MSVKVGRRTARVDRGRRLRRVRVSLRGLPRGRYRVRIRATTARGHRFTLVRTYRTCAPKRR